MTMYPVSSLASQLKVLVKFLGFQAGRIWKSTHEERKSFRKRITAKSFPGCLYLSYGSHVELADSSTYYG